MAAPIKEFDNGVVFPGNIQKLQHKFFPSMPGLKVVSIVGMAGIGKTTLANHVFHHPRNRAYFKYYAWVKVGPGCGQETIMRSIVQQIDPGSGEEGDMRSRVRELLKVRTEYVIVLDDVWDSRLWEDLRGLFYRPIDSHHSLVVLTTRLQDVALSAGFTENVIQMPLMNQEESWDLLRRMLPCPPHLWDAGKKIAEKCDGLPLTIIKVAAILSRDDHPKTPEYWDMIAEKKRDPVFMEAYDQIYEVLYPSYVHLPVYLHQCFLYLGVFPLKYEIRTSKLVKLWNVEEFIELDTSKTSAQVAVEYLKDLYSRSLVLNLQDSWNGGIKTCRLHSVFWYFCVRLGQEKEVFMALDSYYDCSVEDMERQQRLSFHNNVLFGIQDFHSLLDPVSPVRSLLCFGPYHPYQVPICSQLSSLRVIDVLSIRLYDFPIEVVNLNELRYLALTCNGDLPPTISNLKFLEFLIVSRHESIKLSGALMYFLPMEIWDMKELKHLQVTGSNLPDPGSDKLLPNLLTLLDVGTPSCTKSVLQRIPNLEKLGIRIELSPDGAETPPFGNHITCLEKLTSFKCVIVNPTLKSPPPLPDLPLGLEKLSLSGFGYPWEEMSKIALLPNLQVLKLRCYAFQGPRWGSYGCSRSYMDREFKKLRYLLIEDTDLVDWRTPSDGFYDVRHIILKDCYKLEDLPSQFWNSTLVELFDCNPSAAVFRVKHYMPARNRNVHATNSWEKQR